MANTVEYTVSKGFNKNIFIERDGAGINEYDVSKFGIEFFPGNEVLVPGIPPLPEHPSNWEEVITLINAGKFNEEPGFTMPIQDNELFGTFNMELVGIDVDDLASGNGKAKTTWVCKNMVTTYAMNPSATTVGGYAASGMRVYLIDTVLPTLPASIQNSIKSVSKTTILSGVPFDDAISNETIWLLSEREVGSSGPCESSGPIYNAIFTDNNSRVKTDLSGNGGSWWLRSVGDTTPDFRYVLTAGSLYRQHAQYKEGVVFGFCL